MIGRVVSVKTKETATVVVENVVVHPLYKKRYTRSKKYLVQDLLGVKLGDIVEMVKVRPISKNKHWNITKVTGRNIEEIVSEELQASAAEVISEVMPEEEEIEEQSAVSLQTEEKEEKPKKGKKKSAS